MYWMDWLNEEEAFARLRRKLPRLVAYSDKAAIKQNFSRLAAQTAMQEGEGALYRLADELRDLISEPNRQIVHNRFHRL
jgi:hypothetical protein